MPALLRVGLIGAGGNTRLRHIPGLRAIPDVELRAVCNRRAESTARIAAEFAIPRTYARWQDLVADPAIDAIVIGTWPYLHAPITLAALDAGKHVLTEARMAMNASEARAMLAAAKSHPELICQIVPSPFGLKGDRGVRELLASGFVGTLRHMRVVSFNGALADPQTHLSWRQDAALSGVNMLTLGILHETLLRWVPSPVRVLAQTHAFIPERWDEESGQRRAVGTPDHVQVLAELPDGVRATYCVSGVIPFGQEQSITFYGSDGVLRYDLGNDTLTGMNRTTHQAMGEITIPAEMAGKWQVEEDFVASIREGKPVERTDFATGVAYMEFTEAVARSARDGKAIALPSLP